MVNKTVRMDAVELLGRVLDGAASTMERQMVLCSLNNKVFEEYFMVALHATVLYNGKDYGSIQ